MISTTHLQELIQQGISSLQFPASLPGLYEPISYTLEAGGKRLRPVLVLAACQACNVAPDEALSQALGIEMFHNFTLLHDDVMDRADVRRGRPTVHVRWNTPTAILSGDTMLTLATQLMAKCPAEKLPEILGLFNRTAIEIYEGQQMDMDFETRTDVTELEYLEMIRLKTGVLLGAAAAIGANMGNASEATTHAFYDWGVNLGVAFQLRDDYLDTFGDASTFGKATGGDILNDKKTWLLIAALNEAPDATADIIAMPRGQAKIDAMTQLYVELGLPTRIQAAIDEHTTRALDSLLALPLTAPDADWFNHLTLSLTSRQK